VRLFRCVRASTGPPICGAPMAASPRPGNEF
jgi:hypothetical protein